MPHSYIAGRPPCVEAARGRLLCGYVAMWLGGYEISYVAMWLYGYVAMWPRGYVAKFKSLFLKVLKLSQ